MLLEFLSGLHLDGPFKKIQRHRDKLCLFSSLINKLISSTDLSRQKTTTTTTRNSISDLARVVNFLWARKG